MTLRDLIKNEFTVFAEHMPSMDTNELSKAMLRFSSLLASLNDNIAKFEIDFAEELNICLQEEGSTVSGAKVKAQTSQVYKGLRQAKAMKESLENMINAIKFRFKSLQKELGEYTH